MTRRLSVAMALSTAIHLAALSGMVYLWDKARQTRVQAPELHVRIDRSSLRTDIATEPAAIPVDEAEFVAEHTQSGPDDSVPRLEDIPADTDTVPAAASIRPPTELTGPEFDVPQPVMPPAMTDGADPENVSVTAHVTAARPDPERLWRSRHEFSKDQSRMLSRRVREWTEHFDPANLPADGINWQHDGQDYRATFSELADDLHTGIPMVAVEISTTHNGQAVSSNLMLRRLAFSSFAQLVNRWDPNVQIHDDELDGRFHSNSGIQVAYDSSTGPVFHDTVSTAARRVEISRTGKRRTMDEIFRGGLETGVSRISMPRELRPSPDVLNSADSQVIEITRDSMLVFLPDGRYTLRELGSIQSQRSGVLTGKTYFVAHEKSAVHVRGVVRGSALVYSPRRIVVEGDIIYAQNPEHDTGSDDFLGLISDGSIEVAAPAVTGPGDLTINAAIHAKRRFSVRRHRSSRDGVLLLYGSLSAGSVSATEPRFATKIRYDTRLDAARPPGFPMTDRYEVESWDASWRMKTVY